MSERICANPFCCASLAGRRRHAVYCSGACRAEASRQRALSRASELPTLVLTREATEKAHESAQIEPYRYPRSGLTSDEIVAVFIHEFDAVEITLGEAA